MAFNPMFAATPGRPINIRRDIGAALEPDLPPPATVPVGSSDTRDRLTGAAAAIGAGIDPNAPSGLQFVGGVARGFAGVQQYLQAVTGQRTQATADAEKQKREGRLIDAQTDYYKAGAEERRRPDVAPTPARPRAPELRVGEDGFQYERGEDGVWKRSVDERGRPFRPRPTGSGRAPAPPRSTPKTAAQARTRAQELQRDGKSREEILSTMRAEGYDVE